MSEDTTRYSVELSDPLYEEAKQLVIKADQVSITMLQRKLRIGYNRAACMVEAMEHQGIITSFDENGLRHVIHGEDGSICL